MKRTNPEPNSKTHSAQLGPNAANDDVVILKPRRGCAFVSRLVLLAHATNLPPKQFPRWVLLLALAVMFVASGCKETEAPTKDDHAGDASAVKPTNRISVTSKVRTNLGITFVTAEERNVEATIRLPGYFEADSNADTEYRTAFGGRVDVKVRIGESVKAGDTLFTLMAPEWLERRSEIALSYRAWKLQAAEVTKAKAELSKLNQAKDALPKKLAALTKREDAVRETVTAHNDLRTHWSTRVTQLEDLDKRAGGRASELAEARASLHEADSAIAEAKESLADLELTRVEIGLVASGLESEIKVAASEVGRQTAIENDFEATFQMGVATAESLFGIKLADHDWLETANDGMLELAIPATHDGVVHMVHASSGAWVESTAAVVTVRDPSLIVFRAKALQSDLGDISDGALARVVAPKGLKPEFSESIEGRVTISTEADRDAHTLDLLIRRDNWPTWARANIAAEAEVVTKTTGRKEIAVPRRCVVQDGLDMVMFVRDFADPDKVIRTPTELGPSDGVWVVVYSGVANGQEVVMDGVYELKLTGSGKAPKGGHFHADGTFHEGADH